MKFDCQRHIDLQICCFTPYYSRNNSRSFVELDVRDDVGGEVGERRMVNLVHSNETEEHGATGCRDPVQRAAETSVAYLDRGEVMEPTIPTSLYPKAPLGGAFMEGLHPRGRLGQRPRDDFVRCAHFARRLVVAQFAHVARGARCTVGSNGSVAAENQAGMGRQDATVPRDERDLRTVDLTVAAVASELDGRLHDGCHSPHVER